MASLYKRNKTYYITDGSGADRQMISLGRITKPTAQKILQEYRNRKELEKWGIAPAPQPIEACQFIFEYKKHVERVSNESWNKRQQTQLNNYLSTLKNGIYLHEISIRDIQQYVYMRQEDGASPKTIKDEILTLKRMFQQAVMLNHLLNNPCKGVGLPKNRRKRHFPPFTQDQLIIALNHRIHGLYYKVLYYTGLRSSDVSALHSEQINSKMNCITLDTIKTDTPAIIPVHPEIKDILNLTGFIFDTGKSTWTPKSYAHAAYEALKRLIDREGWNTHLTIHSFRVTFNNHLRDKGVSFYDRQTLLTHSASKTTRDYTHPNLDFTRKLIERL